ncbi:fasciclin domain-containing protein [Gilvimarinus sp. SDUM040013]|uniref:Fasciclin domain-containing protein n=1 Tax=Gilvimarinus gilvus TaxID=3058038 RepID=A0ABU4RTY9_9GAMM|nr:fasciclin domain-containing protein [Gilvimarinus sp. SDUM040013]MDO3386729.1 fasciclin domain-containing protein [Gilvimarinus sp. SDUM040013]MDX6848341.1 fasciclin domain-containing protein [Gilvimarinus sp. SDUM040013]
MTATLMRFTAMVLLALGLAACGSDDDNDNEPMPEPAKTIVDVAAANGNFTTLVAALEATGLDATLDDENETFTVFAPTDDAFALLGQDTIDALLADPDTLSNILLYHVIAGSEVDSSAAISSAGSTVEMANGQSVGLSLEGESLMANLSVVTMADVEADNGVIHVIDAVLMPPAERGEPTMNIVETAVDNGSFTTLVAALQAAGLDTTLADESQSYTVFAPTDAAFDMVGADNIAALLGDADALEAVLLQHVVAGEVTSVNAYAANGTNVTTASGAEVLVDIVDRMLTVGGAKVVMEDLYTTNGIIHVIDTVIVGDVDLPAPPMSIVDVAMEAGNFTTLVAALQATGLDTTLADLDTDFTVFAPTDDAFAALGQDTIDALLADTDTLTDILLYHVIVGSEILADGAIAAAGSDMPKVTMGNGDMAGLSLGGEDLYINTSMVSQANVMADNGVIHVIDQVMMPPAEMGMPDSNIVETAIAAGNFTTLVSALQAAGLDATLADEAEIFTVFAPTDDAFAKIDSATLDALIMDVPALTQVLLQHVIQGAAVDSVTAFTLNGTSVGTAASDDVTIEIVDGMLQVQGSNVMVYDIYTNNGVIHVIDTVITETLAP